jgi:U1 small nuclear ribonucleoprotein of 70kDa MW N terminal
MTDKLPANLLALFQPRPPLRYIPPQDTPPEDRALKQSQISGIAAFLPALAEYAADDYYEPTESWLQRKDRIKAEKKARLEEMARDDFKEFQPENDPQIRGDAVKTLFVGRLAYEAKEGDLEREFGRFGPIERVCQNVLQGTNDYHRWDACAIGETSPAPEAFSLRAHPSPAHHSLTFPQILITFTFYRYVLLRTHTRRTPRSNIEATLLLSMKGRKI